jgi:hypothetical protein
VAESLEYLMIWRRGKRHVFCLIKKSCLLEERNAEESPVEQENRILKSANLSQLKLLEIAKSHTISYLLFEINNLVRTLKSDQKVYCVIQGKFI